MVVFLSVASFVAVLISNQEWMKVDPSTLGIAFTLLTQSVYVFQWTVRQVGCLVDALWLHTSYCLHLKYSPLPVTFHFLSSRLRRKIR